MMCHRALLAAMRSRESTRSKSLVVSAQLSDAACGVAYPGPLSSARPTHTALAALPSHEGGPQQQNEPPMSVHRLADGHDDDRTPLEDVAEAFVRCALAVSSDRLDAHRASEKPVRIAVAPRPVSDQEEPGNELKQETARISPRHPWAADLVDGAIRKIIAVLGVSTLTEAKLRQAVGGNVGLTGHALREAVKRRLVEREGRGTRGNPYRYHAAGICSQRPILATSVLEDDGAARGTMATGNRARGAGQP
jgi:hypothetical protein